MIAKPALALAAALACIASVPAAAQAVADLGALDSSVAAFTGAAIGQPGGAAQPLDRRLKLARCAAPPALSWYGTRRDTVMLACPDPGGWRLYVPVLAGSGGTVGAPAVLKGEGVTVTIAGEGFAVSQPGEALDAGPVGAWIRVRVGAVNAQPLRAKVVRPGLVMVDLGNDLP